MLMSKSADEDNIAIAVDKRCKSSDERNDHLLAEAFSTREESLELISKPELILSHDTRKRTVAQKAPSEVSRTHLRSQRHLSTGSRSKAIGNAIKGQDTQLDMANNMAIDAQEITTANNLQEKNDETGDTRKTTELSIPRDTQASPSSAPAPSTIRPDTPGPAAPAEAAAVFPPQLGRPRTTITAAATVTTSATATAPPPLFTCKYCPKQLLTARGIRQHEVKFCKVNPGSAAALQAALPANTGTSQSTGARAGAATEVSSNAGTVSSTSSMTSTSTARQPLPALVLNAASSLLLPSASSLPSNSNASRAAPVLARLPGRKEASPLPAAEYTQRQLDAHARLRKSQSQSQQPAISDVEDVPTTQDIAVNVPPMSHRQLQPQITKTATSTRESTSISHSRTSVRLRVQMKVNANGQLQTRDPVSANL